MPAILFIGVPVVLVVGGGLVDQHVDLLARLQVPEPAPL